MSEWYHRAGGVGTRGRTHASRRVLLEEASEANILPSNFGTGWPSLCGGCLGLLASEPPRGVAWVMLIRTHEEINNNLMKARDFVVHEFNMNFYCQ